ncbi:hypothetical protein [uncultured Negativibacillus sp.]|uniref:hypothetical protein n=1 Tax=uncultured Negativibacillus sp. TaxID=1980696 RepID=UPI0025F5DE8D|nr:hypothetical protein [uncultured Negativibacillus sp.]
MGYLTVLAQQNGQLLFGVPHTGAYFLMPLADLGLLSALSFEWFEEYLPNTPYCPYRITLLEDGSVRDSVEE